MQRIPVKSSNCASVGYDEKACILEVEFNSGGVYRYYDVPPSIHAALLAASSVGAYLDSHIKKAGYRYEKV